ncbi:MAG: type VI secretion system tip protein VgrG [Proteobacteria bacterium]|nr:type VI secretion system tip protein VgrG [Pseudomonadota bacterium]
MSVKQQKTARFVLKVDGLADDDLLIEDIDAYEGLSQPFCYQLRLYSRKKEAIRKDQVKHKNAHLLWRWMEPPRLVHGIIAVFNEIHRPPTDKDGQAASPRTKEESDDGDFNGYRYTAMLVPPMALLGWQKKTRVFNALSTPEIVRQIMGEAKQEIAELKLKERYLKRAHCTQYVESTYEESTLRFVGRILAQDGLCYFFEHDPDPKGKCRLVLVDENDAFRKLPPIDTKKSRLIAEPGPVLRYVKRLPGEQGVSELKQQEAAGPASFVIDEADPDVAETGGKAESGSLGNDAVLSSKTKGTAYHVVLDPTAKKVKGKQNPPEDGVDQELVKRLNTVRAEAAKTQQNLSHGNSNCDRLAAGTRFTLRGYPQKTSKDIELLVVQVHHRSKDSTGPSYGNAFVAFPLALGTYRPPQNIAKPVAGGVDTAKVVSATQQEGAPVDSRPDGRVRVQMGYDSRAPGKDVPAGKSSSWVRVLQPWAGAGHGALFLPRAGDEVIIAYEGGDPDRPIVIGSVYNSQHTAPLLASKAPVGKAKLSGAANLQANCTVAGIVSGGNQFAINDASGRAQVVITAQQDMVVCVMKNHDSTVGGNQREMITGTLDITVTGKVTISSKEEIVLSGGPSSITINKAGVQMKGKVVGVKADSGGGINVGKGKIKITKA